MKSASFDYQRVPTLDEAIRLLGPEDGSGEQFGDYVAKPCSGCQSLGPMLNLRLAQVDRLIDLRQIPELRTVLLSKSSLRIGAATTHAQIEDGLLADVTHGLLPSVAAGIAYRAVRNRGTLGGSLAHADPKSDWVSVVCLLDAELCIYGPDGERQIRASEFFLGPFTTALGPDELLIAIDVPRLGEGARWAYRKFCRKPGEFAQAIGAAYLDPIRGVARGLLGAHDGMPHVIEGATLQQLLAVSDPRAFRLALGQELDAAGIEGAYEREIAAAMLRRAIADLTQPVTS